MLGSISAGRRAGAGRRGRIVVPVPWALSSVTSPPISVARRRQITSPRPGAAVAPGGRRVGLRELLEQARAADRRGMPMPVSVTDELHGLSLRRTSSTTRAATSIPPTSVNFTAFERKLLRIWRNRSGSPTCAAANRSSAVHVSSRPLADAVCTKVATAVRTSATDGEGRRRDLELAGLDLGEVEDVADDLQQRLSGALGGRRPSSAAGASARSGRAPRACRSRRSSACGSRATSRRGTTTSPGWRPRPPGGRRRRLALGLLARRDVGLRRRRPSR